MKRNQYGYPLQRAAFAADDAWSAALQRIYGNDAGDARYDRRGTITPELAALYHAKRTADDACFSRVALQEKTP